MLHEAIAGLKEYLRSNGCGSNVGSFKTREVENFVNGKLLSEMHDLKTRTQGFLDRHEKTMEEVRDVKAISLEAERQAEQALETVAESKKNFDSFCDAVRSEMRQDRRVFIGWLLGGVGAINLAAMLIAKLI